MKFIKTSRAIVNMAAVVKAEIRSESAGDNPNGSDDIDSPEKVDHPVLSLLLVDGITIRLEGDEATRFYRLMELEAEDATCHRDVDFGHLRSI